MSISSQRSLSTAPSSDQHVPSNLAASQGWRCSPGLAVLFLLIPPSCFITLTFKRCNACSQARTLFISSACKGLFPAWRNTRTGRQLAARTPLQHPRAEDGIVSQSCYPRQLGAENKTTPCNFQRYPNDACLRNLGLIHSTCSTCFRGLSLLTFLSDLDM